MNNSNPEAKSALMKTFAVFGFVLFVLFAAWLAIKIVSLVPAAFSSLASLYDSVHNQETQEQIEIATQESVVNADEAFSVSWTDTQTPGSYVLSYECIDGVDLDIELPNGNVIPVDCGAPYVLPAGVFSVEAIFSSDAERLVSVPYSVSFIETGNTEASFTASKTLTLLNVQMDGTDNTTDSEASTVDTEVATETETPVDTPTSTPKPETPVTGVKTTYTTYTKIPTSDPNGTIDLEVKWLSVGELIGSTYTIKGNLEEGERGAFQFVVKNIGTKTSDDWKFKAELTSGDTYTSKTQLPLKPNEQQVVTIAFDDIGEEGVQPFGVVVTGGDDDNTTNNKFDWAVRIVD